MRLGLIVFQDRFECEANNYDDRALVPEHVWQATAAKLVSIAGMGDGDLAVEIGVGSGQVSRWLCQHPIRFIGIDMSKAMLDICAGKLPKQSDRCLLLQADCRGCWPVASASARLIFGSRSLHLIRPGHVAAEVMRLMSKAGGTFVIGRVERPSDSLHTVLKRQMNRQLRSSGYTVSEGASKTGDVLLALLANGASRLEQVQIGQWSVSLTPRATLTGWADRSGLAGCDVPDKEKRALLASLASWAEAEFGSLDHCQSCPATYVLYGAGLPANRT